MWACNSVPAPLTPAKLRHHFCCCCCCLVYLYLPWWPCQVIFFHSFYFLAFISSRHEIYNAIQGRNEPIKREKKNVGRQRVCGWVGPSDCRIFIKTKKKQKKEKNIKYISVCVVRIMRWYGDAMSPSSCIEPIHDWYIYRWLIYTHITWTRILYGGWLLYMDSLMFPHIHHNRMNKKKNVENIIEMMVFSFQEFLESVIFLCVCR